MATCQAWTRACSLQVTSQASRGHQWLEQTAGAWRQSRQRRYQRHCRWHCQRHVQRQQLTDPLLAGRKGGRGRGRRLCSASDGIEKLLCLRLEACAAARCGACCAGALAQMRLALRGSSGGLWGGIPPREALAFARGCGLGSRCSSSSSCSSRLCAAWDAAPALGVGPAAGTGAAAEGGASTAAEAKAGAAREPALSLSFGLLG